MLIKYKGNTSLLLTDLSLELKIPVNLKVSENILQEFFEKILQELSLERSIEFICHLPPHLKPFCKLPVKEDRPDHGFFSYPKISSTIKAIMKVLEKYIRPERLAKIYLCFPDNLFINSVCLKKEALQHV